MSEEETKHFSGGRSFEELVLSGLNEIRTDIATNGEMLKGLALRMSSFEDRLTSFEVRFSSFEDRLTSFEVRLTSLEEKVDARLRETRPIWEAVQASVLLLDKKFDLMVKDLYDLRGNFGMHESWLRELDRRVNP
ncbi:MAG TPA: hypothetical protein VN643_02305 [Pyrinomonadaceae bacterium]|nr:hypothetical protein [Pyrinomonadaceae bacterium]